MTVSPVAILSLLTNTVIWGLSWIAFKSLHAYGLHPLWATSAILGGCVVLLFVLRPRVFGQLRGHPQLLLVAVAAGLTNLAFNSAIAFGDVVRVVLLFYLMPVWSILLARIVLKEPVSRRAVIRIAVGLAGAMVVLYKPEAGLPFPSSAVDWIALGGGAAFALNNVMLRRLQGVPDGARSVAMLAGGTVLAGLLGVVFGAVGMVPQPVLSQLGPAVPVLLLWIALMLVANLCLQYGVARLPANITAVVMLNEIMVATVSAWWMGTAAIGPQEMIGGAMIIMAPWLLRGKY